jgi:DNA polymerase elongation subunit (family B)
MRAYNMCFSTLIPSYTEAQKQGLKWSEETQMIKDPSDPNYPEMRPIRSFEYPEGGKFKYVLKKTDVCFHTSTKRYGILPEILHQLLNERSRVKKLRKKYGEKSMDYAVLDGRQLALKVCANSVYGFTGAGMGYLGEKRIASSVTRVGRGMANHTKAMCEEKYKEHGLEIVYGDTVSLFNASLFFVSFSDLSFRTRVGLCLCEHTSFHVRYELFAGRINYKGGQDWH